MKPVVIIKVASVTAVVVASVAAPVALWHSQQAQWEQTNQLQRDQAIRMAALVAENSRLSHLIAQAKTPPLSPNQVRELLRLRGEIGPLRQAASELDRLRAANRQLSARTASPPNSPSQ